MPLTIARPEAIPGTAQFGRTSVDYLITPAANPIDDVPVLIAKGFGGTAKAYQALAGELADQGKHSVNSGSPRCLPILEELDPRNFLHPHRLASQSLRAVMEDVHEEHDIDQFDIVAHSKAGRDVMWVAHHMPERVRTILFVGSVGMGENRLHSFIPRVPQFLRHELPEAASAVGQNAGWQDVAEMAGHFLLRPHRTAGEILAIHWAKVDHRLPGLSENGIKTAVIELENDTLLPPKSTRPDVAEHADHHEIFSEGSARHVAPITKPEEMARAAIAILHKLHYESEQAAAPSA